MQDVPWEDVHFWSGSQKNVNLENHETINLIDEGYRLMSCSWGPSVMRRLDVQLNGYAHCRESSNPVLCRHKAKFFKQHASLFWLLLPACDRYAPNGAVRRRSRKIDEKYRAYVGEPTPVMRMLAAAIDKLVIGVRAREFLSPANRHVPEEPFKRFVYAKSNGNGASRGSKGSGGTVRVLDTVPYRTERPSLDVAFEAGRVAAKPLWTAVWEACEAIRRVCPTGGDVDIDSFILEKVGNASFGFGF